MSFSRDICLIELRLNQSKTEQFIFNLNLPPVNVVTKFDVASIIRLCKETFKHKCNVWDIKSELFYFCSLIEYPTEKKRKKLCRKENYLCKTQKIQFMLCTHNNLKSF